MAKEKKVEAKNPVQKAMGVFFQIIGNIRGFLKNLNPLTFFKNLAVWLRGFKMTDRLRYLSRIGFIGGATTIAGIFVGILCFAIYHFIEVRKTPAPRVATTQIPETPTPGANLSGAEFARFNRIFNSFSPLAEGTFLANLGLEDRNNNGVIDMGKDEGYEEFIQKYGTADRGFWVNGIIQGSGNGKLEEPEIINHYYLYIRYKFPNETRAVDQALEKMVQEQNLPLLWMDDRNGTAMQAVQAVVRQFRIPWPQSPIDEEQAEAFLIAILQRLRVRGIAGNLESSQYVELPEFINRRAGHSAEVAHFAFWLFSQLPINTIPVKIMLSPEIRHEGIRFAHSNRVIDYFGSSQTSDISDSQWQIQNPLQSLGNYYFSLARNRRNRRNAIANYEQALVYNKYSISYAAALMEERLNNVGPSYKELIAIGEFILQSTDLRGIYLSKDPEADTVLANLGSILSILSQSYSITKDTQNVERIAGLIKEYITND